jgi:hypothetical protein
MESEEDQTSSDSIIPFFDSDSQCRPNFDSNYTHDPDDEEFQSEDGNVDDDNMEFPSFVESQSEQETELNHPQVDEEVQFENSQSEDESIDPITEFGDQIS